VIYEFYVVATRPENSNGLGLSPENAIKEVDNIIGTYIIIDDNNQIFPNWKELVKTFRVSGKTAHDARIVALMQSHGINKLYTLNRSDFKRFETIISLV